MTLAVIGSAICSRTWFVAARYAVTFHHPCFPSFILTATSYGNRTPLYNISVSCFTGSIHTSNGKQHTYQLAQKKPTGHARNHSTMNQIMAHKTFIVAVVLSDE